MTPDPRAERALQVIANPWAYAYVAERSTPVAPLATPQAKAEPRKEHNE